MPRHVAPPVTTAAARAGNRRQRHIAHAIVNGQLRRGSWIGNAEIIAVLADGWNTAATAA
jgi:hypothetical protein